MLTSEGTRVPATDVHLPRHHDRCGAGGGHRRQALPPAAARGRAGPGRHGHRLRRDRLALPRVDRLPARGAGGRCGRLSRRTFGAEPARGAGLQRDPRPGAGRPPVRGRPRRRRDGQLARPRGRAGLRLPRLAGRGRPDRAGPHAARGRRGGAPHGVRRRGRPAPRGRRDLPPAGLDPRDRRLRRPAAGPPPARGREVRRPAGPAVVPRCPKKLVLAVIDSLKPDMLDLAIDEGRAPALEALRERGAYNPNCLSTFPSVTPVASAAIATGSGPGGHHIPSMNWYHRGEERYVEYGSSFPATRAFGVVRSLYDTVYNMNMAHLTRAHKTVFEHLDDAGLRTACTTWLIYRGRTRHDPSGASVYRRIAEAAQFRHAVYGAGELFYADLFDSRNTGCTSALGMPGQRDQHTGCVGAYLVEHDLFDFLLFSLPDNDTHSHRRGPYAQVTSIASADRALERIMHVAGGVDAFLEDHAVIVMSDHSQTKVEEPLNLADVFSSWRVLIPADPAPTEAELALCPSARAGMVYVLDPRQRDELVPRAIEALAERGALRFVPGGELVDRRGRSWSVWGEHETLGLEVGDGRVASDTYPDALGRLWSALECPHSGDLLLSASPGFEFVDWGGADHVGGGSHGSLHRDDSAGVLLFCGIEAPEREEWSLLDVASVVLDHFRVRFGG